MYINNIVKKAHCTANMTHRCSVPQHVSLLVRAFVIPLLLEYSSVTWSPSLKRDIQYIQQVQRRLTKRLRGKVTLWTLLRGFHDHSSAEHLQLEVRRLKFDLIMCYKIIFDIVRVN